MTTTRIDSEPKPAWAVDFGSVPLRLTLTLSDEERIALITALGGVLPPPERCEPCAAVGCDCVGYPECDYMPSAGESPTGASAGSTTGWRCAQACASG